MWGVLLALSKSDDGGDSRWSSYKGPSPILTKSKLHAVYLHVPTHVRLDTITIIHLWIGRCYVKSYRIAYHSVSKVVTWVDWKHFKLLPVGRRAPIYSRWFSCETPAFWRAENSDKKIQNPDGTRDVVEVLASANITRTNATVARWAGAVRRTQRCKRAGNTSTHDNATTAVNGPAK